MTLVEEARRIAPILVAAEAEVALIDFVDAVIELSKASPPAGWVAGVIGVASVAAGAVRR